MDTKEFIKLVREGTDRLRVDKVVVNAGSVKLRGSGTLRIDVGKRLRIDLTLKGRDAPPAHNRVTTKKDAWSLSGIIESHLRFRCDNVSPGGRWSTFNGVITITRTLHSIELVTDFDSTKAIRKRKALHKRIGLEPSQDPNEYNLDRSFSFKATLVNCELPAVNAGTETTWTNDFLLGGSLSEADTFMGELATSRYAFIRSKNKRDLDIYLRSKDDCRSVSEEDDWRKFRALMNALAFTGGVHPWPFHTKYERGEYLISEKVSAARTPAKTDYSPFNRAIGRQHSENFGTAIRATAEFLESDTSLNRQLTHLLFLFREAGKDTVQLEIRILALCALLEGLVRTLYKELSLGDGLSHKKEKQLGAREVFEAVATRLKIPWENEMESLFNEWKQARNPSAHGDFPSELEPEADEHEAVQKMFYGMSRIAGGFNMILLKLFGYSGVYRSSALEDAYRKL